MDDGPTGLPENWKSFKRVDDINIKFEKINNGKSAFQENHVFIVSPLKSSAKGESITFKISEDFIFQNSLNKQINTLTIDFGNQQIHTVIENGILILPQITITYTEDGDKQLLAQATMTDGTIHK